MTIELLENFAISTLAAPIDADDLSLSVASGEGSRFSSPGSGEQMHLVIGTGPDNYEIVVSSGPGGRTGDAIANLARQQEGTGPHSWDAGTPVFQGLTIEALNNITLAWSKLSGIPGSFVPANHDHSGSVPNGGSPLAGDNRVQTTKGDLIGRSSSAPVRVPVGSNGQVLIADSTQASGLNWTLLSALVNSAILPDYQLRWDNTTGHLRKLNCRTGVSVRDDDPGFTGPKSLFNALLEETQVISKGSGTGGLGHPGAVIQLIAESADNAPVLIDDTVGVPLSSTDDFTAGVATFTDHAHVLTHAHEGRAIAIKDAKTGPKDHNTVIDSVNTSTHVVTLHNAPTRSVTGTLWSLTMWTGVTLIGTGIGNFGQGNGHPDAGSAILVAKSGGSFVKGDRKGLINFRENGFGAADAAFLMVGIAGNDLCDYGFLGFGTGTGNAVHEIGCKATGFRLACRAIGGYEDSYSFGSQIGSADVYWAANQWSNPTNGGHRGTTGTVNSGSATFTAAELTADDVGRICVIYGGRSSNRPLVVYLTAAGAGTATMNTTASNNKAANATWFTLGGVGLYIGVGDAELSNFNVASGGEYSIVIDVFGSCKITRPCHVGGSDVGPDCLVLACSNGDLDAYWDNIGRGSYTAGRVGGVTVLPKDASAIGALNIHGRFNINATDTPLVCLDGGGGAPATQDDGLNTSGPITLSRLYTNGIAGLALAVIGITNHWNPNVGLYVGADVKCDRTAQLYVWDGSGTNKATGATSTARPWWIDDDVLIANDTGGAAKPGMNAERLYVTVASGTGSANHRLRTTPTWFTPPAVIGATPPKGRLSVDATSTTITVHSSDVTDGFTCSVLAVCDGP